MKKTLDIDTWARKEHFHFFRKFEEPFWIGCLNVSGVISMLIFVFHRYF